MCIFCYLYVTLEIMQDFVRFAQKYFAIRHRVYDANKSQKQTKENSQKKYIWSHKMVVYKYF